MAIDKVTYWKELADYDIDTAEVMFTGGRWLYVGFMCHQVVEKQLRLIGVPSNLMRYLLFITC